MITQCCTLYLSVIAILFDNISGRTTHLVDNNGVEGYKDNSLNYKISCTASPDQGSTVLKNPSRTVLGTKHLQESEISCFTTNDQGSTVPKFLSDNDFNSNYLQESELSCLLTNNQGSTVSNNNDITLLSREHLQYSAAELSCFTTNDQGSTVLEYPSDTDFSSNHLELSCLATDDSFTKEPQHMINAACTFPTIGGGSNLQDQSTMMDYKEEPTCSSDVVITAEDQVAACVTEGIIRADIPSSVFEEVISDVHDEEDDAYVTSEFGVHELRHSL